MPSSEEIKKLLVFQGFPFTLVWGIEAPISGFPRPSPKNWGQGGDDDEYWKIFRDFSWMGMTSTLRFFGVLSPKIPKKVLGIFLGGQWLFFGEVLGFVP